MYLLHSFLLSSFPRICRFIPSTVRYSIQDLLRTYLPDTCLVFSFLDLRFRNVGQETILSPTTKYTHSLLTTRLTTHYSLLTTHNSFIIYYLLYTTTTTTTTTTRYSNDYHTNYTTCTHSCCPCSVHPILSHPHHPPIRHPLSPSIQPVHLPSSVVERRGGYVPWDTQNNLNSTQFFYRKSLKI